MFTTISWRRGAALLLAIALPLAASGQGPNQWEPDLESTDNVPYNGRFTFSRIRYGGGGWFGNASWAHDYPRADRHMPQILSELTTLEPNLSGSNVFDLDDPEIFRHPIIYVSEPGFWRMRESHVQKLRAYMLKGGFVIFDDFEEEQLYNLQAQLRRSLPEYEPIEIDVKHPIFHTFFETTNIYIPHPMVPVIPRYLGIFENNDPSKRMMAILNHNNDLAEFWEWSDSGLFPVDYTNEAYKIGINYIVYGMTH
jgi:hypothetical protein